MYILVIKTSCRFINGQPEIGNLEQYDTKEAALARIEYLENNGLYGELGLSVAPSTEFRGADLYEATPVPYTREVEEVEVKVKKQVKVNIKG